MAGPRLELPAEPVIHLHDPAEGTVDRGLAQDTRSGTFLPQSGVDVGKYSPVGVARVRGLPLVERSRTHKDVRADHHEIAPPVDVRLGAGRHGVVPRLEFQRRRLDRECSIHVVHGGANLALRPRCHLRADNPELGGLYGRQKP